MNTLAPQARPLIELRNVTKSFPTSGGLFKAVDDVSLDIYRGEIFGIMGQSGAGKSTLLRTINLLERPTQGSVIVEGLDITLLDKRRLREQRQSIGMIFQQFNLLQNANAFDNVAFPLALRRAARRDIRARVMECLSIVGIANKASSYPAQLSGGQKQRVAIARALATEPSVLLCDEPTSALDTETAQSVLQVLRDVNQRLSVTIVIVTHQIEVVQRLCQRLAEMREGRIVRLSKLEGFSEQFPKQETVSLPLFDDAHRLGLSSQYQNLSALNLVGG